ncbi:endoribonuclease [Canna indica]|uniref:Endoribonuclease n=1 Tax=Canna indica TaxID=4628 RepID=A0AAQ3KJI2_9LILI|nr:endoribonuclease [Canna indica]
MNPLKRPVDPADCEGSPLAKKQRRECQEFEPRSYQVAIYEMALQRNTIAVLDTGSGKTMIAVMLIKHFGKELNNGGDQRRLIVFLAPTVPLVTQQYEEIKNHTDLSVQYYCGAKGVDEWSIACWQKEASNYQVMVMTPQVFLDAMRKAFLNLQMVRLMVLDECHHACGNHPYSRLMKEFYHKCMLKPRIFGMTASPLIRKGVASVTDCEDQLSELEFTLDSKIYTIADKTEMNLFVPAAKEINIYYDRNPFKYEKLKAKLGLLSDKYDALIVQLQNSALYEYKDIENIIEASKKNLSGYYAKICHCIDELGLICAMEATKLFKDAVSSAEGCDFFMGSKAHCKSFLEEVSHELEESLSGDVESLLKNGDACLEAVQRGYISPKLYELLQIFQSFGFSNQVLCLIFVERIITAKVTERFIKKIGYLSHFSVSYLTGGGSSVDGLTLNIQKKTLDLFRSGKVNLLFTTDVAEEGIHVPACSCVIRFDLPKTVRSYVQSRGRARQAGSHYLIMLERGNSLQKDIFFEIMKSNRTMLGASLTRDQESLVSKVSIKEELDAYYVDSTGASVTADSSVSVINIYCQNLPRDKNYTPKPVFKSNQYGGCYECTLILPPTAAIQTVVGPVHRNSHVAKKLVCLEACKRLHQLGALNDHLLPCIEEPLDDVSIEKKRESAEGAGTTKRKELHGTTTVHVMSGTWIHQNDGISLQGYKLKFSCNHIGQNYSAFILLIDTILDEDVACMEMDLYLVDKMVKAYISPCGPVALDKEQVEEGKLFQQFFFNGLFGKLFTGSKSSGAPREFLLKDGRSLWNTSDMYMVLPLDSSSAHEHDTVSINWKAIHASVSVVKFMKDIYSAGAQKSPVVNSTCGSSEMLSCMLDMIHLADRCVNPQSLKDVVVLAFHTGRIYSVLDVAVDLCADSPFDGNSEKSLSKFPTFSDYFSKKYGIVLQHPRQPLLLLKSSHNPHNLLSLKSEIEGNCLAKKSKGKNAAVSKPKNHVHMPPELLVYVDIPLKVLKSFYLLPSLMYRMESLMLACQLRKEIAFCPINSVSSSLILEAITTQRCCEDFSLERLELLGDSVLKYAVSCYLFLKYPDKHEGQLSSQRTKIICNATLHSLGTKRGIQGYIRDAAFEPRRWVAPGQITLHPVPCKCELDDHEVPNKIMYTIDDKSIVIGKACDRGHRWICSKTVSDCVEALIGAYYVGGGLPGAIAFLKWLGIDTIFEPQMVEEAIRTASVWDYLPNNSEIETLESKIAYKFTVKGLLLEAVTHASQQEIGICFCYQRLEFLGDSVLDILITWYLFQSHKDVDPGELTDLRSASVNNDNFAQVAVMHKLQEHLQHNSGLLLEKIMEYVKRLEDSAEDKYSLLSNGSSKAPKVLGDIVESIAGAILIDTKLDLKKVWEIFQPLLSPIVTPDNLELPPLRELIELCDHHGYFLKTTCTIDGDMVVAILEVQLEDVLLIRKGSEKTKKVAKGQAAYLLLKDLEEKGLVHNRYSSKEMKAEEKKANHNEHVDESCNPMMDMENSDTSKPTKAKEKNSNPIAHVEKSYNSTMDMEIPTPANRAEVVKPGGLSDPDLNKPVLLTVNMKKGGPRTSLYELCKKRNWKMPSFESIDWISSNNQLATCGNGGEACKMKQIFVSRITLQIPNVTVIKLDGDRRPDKKSSHDSAALAMLYELEKQSWCQILLV